MTATVVTDLLALLDQLDEARAKGTPGPWRQDPAHPRYIEAPDQDDLAEALDPADTALIVAAVNATPRLTATLRAVLAEHQPLMNTNPRQPACPDCLGGINAADPDEARPCGCWGLSTPVCSSCADHHVGRRFALQWPCPTAQALTAALAGAAR